MDIKLLIGNMLVMAFHDFDRCSIGLIEKNEMINDLIMVMNELWTEINYQN